MDFELKKRHKGRINIWYGSTASVAGGSAPGSAITSRSYDAIYARSGETIFAR